MAEKKMSMPQGMAGLTRYYDVKEGAVRISPKAVVALATGFSLFIIILNAVA
ncbi:MAG: preprotein translocase subunit Sec61beta [Candidatus Aenigmarchaeota archaeon]|nr:preprotein translocase subunit Sec61beta [Candidatus Aenigmarchaeota archaeon]